MKATDIQFKYHIYNKIYEMTNSSDNMIMNNFLDYANYGS